MNRQDGGKNIIFIVGCPRSGTTYLQKLIASNPKVKTGQESNIFSSIGPLLDAWDNAFSEFEENPKIGVGLACYFEKEQLLFMLKDFVNQLFSVMTGNISDDSYFLEKTPAHALYIKHINKLLPNARILHIIRDPRDTVASLLAASRSWGRSWAPSNAKDAALVWNRYIITALESARQINSGNYFEIKYEALISNPYESMVNVSKFIGLEWDKDQLKDSIAFNDISMARVNGGTEIRLGGTAAILSGNNAELPLGFIRQGTSGMWKSDLNLREKFIVWKTSRKLMESVGYKWIFPW